MSATRVPAFHERDGHLAIELPGGTALFSRGVDVTQALGAEALASAAGIPVARWAQDRQAHGTAVRMVRSPADLDRSGEHDAQVTALRGVAVMVRTADCLPIALASPAGVGMVHAGWRGLAAGVIQEGLAALRALGPREVHAAIGPGAGPCCYEVGEDVHAQLAAIGPGLRRGRCADLKAAAARILGEAGVRDVHDAGECTICAPAGRYWSHRRDGTGARNAGLAWRS